MTRAAEIAATAKRLDNDVNGNPRYYVAKFMFPPMTDKTRLDAGLNLYRGKQYGAGYVLQSYSLESDVQFALDTIAKATGATPFPFPGKRLSAHSA